MALEIEQFTCLSDNFGVLIHDTDSGRTAAIDAPEAGKIDAVLSAKGWTLTDIMVTHHHHDHTGGIEELKGKYGCKVVGPKAEASKIPGIDEQLSEGDVFALGDYEFQVFETPGHTAGHIVFYSPKAEVLFAADTLFSLGCGRLFEKGPVEMWSSMTKLRALPPETKLYCGHEYTLANARFAVTVDPGNEALKMRAEEVQRQRNEGKPTLPVTLGAEFEVNPFLRADDPGIRKHLGMEGASDEEVFGEIRKRKDNF